MPEPHHSHCFEGEYATSCKYGEDATCPARPMPEQDKSDELDNIHEWAQANGINGLTNHDELSVDLYRLRAGIETIINQRLDEFAAELNEQLDNGRFLAPTKAKTIIDATLAKFKEGEQTNG